MEVKTTSKEDKMDTVVVAVQEIGIPHLLMARNCQSDYHHNYDGGHVA